MSVHIVSHLVIFVGYILACLQVPPAFRSIIYIRPLTIVAGGGFFLTCGITHMSVALEVSDAWWAQLDAHAQAVFIISFLWLLAQDLASALKRLQAAFRHLFEELDDETAAKVVAVIKKSLGGRD